MVVSDTVKEYYKNGSHGKVVTISFPDLDYTVPSENVYFESLDLEEAIFDGDSFEAVGCIASKFEISIRDFGEDVKGQKIVADIDLVDVEDSTIRLFTGIVDSVQMESNKQVKKLTAYDALYALGNTDVANWYKSLTFPISIGAFRHSLCTHIGLDEVSGTLPNDSITINKQYNPNTLNALDLLKNICQINGVFGIINRQGYMEYRVPSASTAEEIPYTRDIEYQEYLVDPVDKLTIRQDQDSPGVSYGTGNNNYIIQGNFFTYGLSPETVYDIARNMYSNVSSFTYRPFKASNNGLPFIELGLNNSVAYRVYDFENSSSGHDVYKNITVIVMSRHLKGIQSIVDDYEAKGNEDQRLFISDLGTEIQALKETIENLDKASSTEIAVYRNKGALSILSGQSGVVSDISFTAKPGNTVVFTEEISLIASSDELITQDAYTEGDPEILVKYILNGVEVPNRASNGLILDGKNIVSLMQFWKAGQNTHYRLQTVMWPTNCSISIPAYMAGAYITVRTSEFDDFQIAVTKMPNKEFYLPEETIDFTGIVVSKVYYDDSTSDVDITSLCTFSPVEGSTIQQGLLTVNVSYREQNESGEYIDYFTEFYLSAEPREYDLVIVSLPNQTEYLENNDYFDFTGLKIVKKYEDTGEEVDITNECIYDPEDGSFVGSARTVIVHVTYNNSSIYESPAQCTDTFDLEVLTAEEMDIDFDPEFEDENFLVDTIEDLSPDDPMYGADPFGDESYENVVIPYVLYKVDYDEPCIYMYALDVSAITNDNPADVRIPARVRTKTGTIVPCYITTGWY